jgi:hypothetical protein
MTRITSIARGARKLITDNSPAILTAVAVGGVVATTLFAVKATPQAVRDIQHAESERTEPLNKVEKVQLCWKYYVPAATMGVMTIACIIGATSIQSKRHAALISAYTLSEKAMTEYQEKVKEHFGEGKEQKVRDDIAQDTVNANPVSENKVIVTGAGEHLFMDKKSGRYFKSTVDKVGKAENKLNFELNNNAYASLNDFYGYLGIDHSDMGDELGWQSDSLVEVRLSTVLAEDIPCIVIDFSVAPIHNYWKFGGN